MKVEQVECSETSAYKVQTPGNHPEENVQHTEHGESMKSRTLNRFNGIILSDMCKFVFCAKIYIYGV
jgi:hypothetical protein